MAGIFEYLDWRGDIPMKAVPLCDADRLILSELAYIDFGNDGPKPLYILCEEMLRRIEAIRTSGAKLKLLHHKKDEELLRVLAEKPRFRELLIGHCESRTSRQREEQFGAMTVYLPDDSVACVFRGTDWSLVGWKEDFNMAYCEALPAQQSAVRYITRIGNIHDGRIHVMGHSKGGNLAVYAAAFAPEDTAKRISSITSLDGPGFCEKVMKSTEYGFIKDRVRTFMPKASIVGVLFSRTGRFTVIESRASGLMQHIPYNWEIMGGDFVTASEQDGSSQLVEDALNDWIRGMTTEERKRFIDTVWSVLADLKIDEFDDLLDGKNARAIIKNYAALDDEARTLIAETLAKLRSCTKASLRELYAKEKRK